MSRWARTARGEVDCVALSSHCASRARPAPAGPHRPGPVADRPGLQLGVVANLVPVPAPSHPASGRVRKITVRARGAAPSAARRGGVDEGRGGVRTPAGIRPGDSPTGTRGSGCTRPPPARPTRTRSPAPGRGSARLQRRGSAAPRRRGRQRTRDLGRLRGPHGRPLPGAGTCRAIVPVPGRVKAPSESRDARRTRTRPTPKPLTGPRSPSPGAAAGRPGALPVRRARYVGAVSASAAAASSAEGLSVWVWVG